jgi:GntR family transcriptional regulator/MocR family aminotransferase
VTRPDPGTLAAPPRKPGMSAHGWLCGALRRAILDGRLRPGARLPATRDLALQYGLARGTVVTAFDQMKAEGYIVARTGSGTYVNAVLPDSLLEVSPGRSDVRRVPIDEPRRLSDVARRQHPFPSLSPHRTRAFRANLPALDLFPTTLWAQVAGRSLRRASVDLRRGCEALGHRPLRKAVAEYLRASRGVTCAPEQVVILSGVQEALDLASRLLLNPGDRVCMENPGYVGAARIFEACGAHVVALPVDAEGMVLPGQRGQQARLVYVTPAHQFPVGVSMSLPRRLALIGWARRAGAVIFEDDYDSEYRYSGSPMPALQGLDRHGLVVYAGSFSKVLFPSLRLGYLVVPEDLVDPVSAIKSVANRFAPLLDQAILADFITEGHFSRHVRRMRTIYAERSSVLVEAVRRHLGEFVQMSNLEAGLQTTIWLRRGLSADAVTAMADRRNVEALPVSRYTWRPIAREGLVLGFAAVDPDEIRRGVRVLQGVLEADQDR